jgi:hypothetical protein
VVVPALQTMLTGQAGTGAPAPGAEAPGAVGNPQGVEST